MSSFWFKFIIYSRKWIFNILHYFIVTLELSPKNLAIILDGHRTFSQRNHISPTEAYMRGWLFEVQFSNTDESDIFKFFQFYSVENTLQIIRLCKSLGTESITFFLFSQHNWRRDAKTTQVIFEQMTIFLEKLAQNTWVYRAIIYDQFGHELLIDFVCNRVGYRYKILGDYTKMPLNIRQICDKLIDETKSNDGTAIILAINYSCKYLTNCVPMIIKSLMIKLNAIFIQPGWKWRM